MGEIVRSDEYRSFRSVVPQRKIGVTGDIEWTIYDTGPKHVDTPIIFIPPASGTADIFYRQLLALSASGIRAISVDHPVVWDVKRWCAALERLIKYLRLSKVHIFGASLGAFLAQKFCQMSAELGYVHSLILCNGFTDTDIFNRGTSSVTYWAMPAVLLKNVVMGSFNKHRDKEINDSIEFMKDRLDSLTQEQLAARLTLNCASDYVEPQEVARQGISVMLMNVFDQCALSEQVVDDLYKCYPGGRRALLKTGGNFPYLSRSAEVNVYIQIHLQQFAATAYTPYTRELEPPTSDQSDFSGYYPPPAKDEESSPPDSPELSPPTQSEQPSATARLPTTRLDPEGHTVIVEDRTTEGEVAEGGGNNVGKPGSPLVDGGAGWDGEDEDEEEEGELGRGESMRTVNLNDDDADSDDNDKSDVKSKSDGNAQDEDEGL